jgi:hypothetical protein
MDNLGNGNLSSNDDLDKPIPFGEDLDTPIPLDDNPTGGSPGVSRAPLSLGGGGAAPAPAPRPQAPAPRPQAPAARPQASGPRPQAPAPADKAATSAAPGGRITGVKTFFTKLHGGAIEFLDGQISSWLKANPQIAIKRTNIAVGEVQAKKTEPNILITVWY